MALFARSAAQQTIALLGHTLHTVKPAVTCGELAINVSIINLKLSFFSAKTNKFSFYLVYENRNNNNNNKQICMAP